MLYAYETDHYKVLNIYVYGVCMIVIHFVICTYLYLYFHVFFIYFYFENKMSCYLQQKQRLLYCTYIVFIFDTVCPQIASAFDSGKQDHRKLAVS